jgi:hypothetical protein
MAISCAFSVFDSNPHFVVGRDIECSDKFFVVEAGCLDELFGLGPKKQSVA